jgi:hypothetical protein
VLPLRGTDSGRSLLKILYKSLNCVFNQVSPMLLPFNLSKPGRSHFHYTSLLFTLLLMTIAQHTYSQSRSGLGLRFGINKPYADAYKFGYGAALQMNIALNKKWGVELAVANDRINGDKETVYLSEPYTFIEAESLSLIHFDLAMRYYITPNLFARLGPVLYIAGGNEDLVAGGIGGTAAVGYQWMMDKRNKLEVVFNTDIIDSGNGRGNGIIPIAGLKVAYSFNFSNK